MSSSGRLELLHRVPSIPFWSINYIGSTVGSYIRLSLPCHRRSRWATQAAPLVASLGCLGSIHSIRTPPAKLESFCWKVTQTERRQHETKPASLKGWFSEALSDYVSGRTGSCCLCPIPAWIGVEERKRDAVGKSLFVFLLFVIHLFSRSFFFFSFFFIILLGSIDCALPLPPTAI